MSSGRGRGIGSSARTVRERRTSSHSMTSQTPRRCDGAETFSPSRSSRPMPIQMEWRTWRIAFERSRGATNGMERRSAGTTMASSAPGLRLRSLSWLTSGERRLDFHRLLRQSAPKQKNVNRVVPSTRCLTNAEEATNSLEEAAGETAQASKVEPSKPSELRRPISASVARGQGSDWLTWT